MPALVALVDLDKGLSHGWNRTWLRPPKSCPPLVHLHHRLPLGRSLRVDGTYVDSDTRVLTFDSKRRVGGEDSGRVDELRDQHFLLSLLPTVCHLARIRGCLRLPARAPHHAILRVATYRCHVPERAPFRGVTFSTICKACMSECAHSRPIYTSLSAMDTLLSAKGAVCFFEKKK